LERLDREAASSSRIADGCGAAQKKEARQAREAPVWAKRQGKVRAPSLSEKSALRRAEPTLHPYTTSNVHPISRSLCAIANI